MRRCYSLVDSYAPVPYRTAPGTSRAQISSTTDTRLTLLIPLNTLILSDTIYLTLSYLSTCLFYPFFLLPTVPLFSSSFLYHIHIFPHYFPFTSLPPLSPLYLFPSFPSPSICLSNHYRLSISLSIHIYICLSISDWLAGSLSLCV